LCRFVSLRKISGYFVSFQGFSFICPFSSLKDTLVITTLLFLQGTDKITFHRVDIDISGLEVKVLDMEQSKKEAINTIGEEETEPEPEDVEPEGGDVGTVEEETEPEDVKPEGGDVGTVEEETEPEDVKPEGGDVGTVEEGTELEDVKPEGGDVGTVEEGTEPKAVKPEGGDVGTVEKDAEPKPVKPEDGAAVKGGSEEVLGDESLEYMETIENTESEDEESDEDEDDGNEDEDDGDEDEDDEDEVESAEDGDDDESGDAAENKECGEIADDVGETGGEGCKVGEVGSEEQKDGVSRGTEDEGIRKGEEAPLERGSGDCKEGHPPPQVIDGQGKDDGNIIDKSKDLGDEGAQNKAKLEVRSVDEKSISPPKVIEGKNNLNAEGGYVAQKNADAPRVEAAKDETAVERESGENKSSPSVEEDKSSPSAEEVIEGENKIDGKCPEVAVESVQQSQKQEGVHESSEETEIIV
jgi:hypothetical protein